MTKRQSLLHTADVPPLDVDGVRAVAAGTALWLVALLVSVVLRDRLDDAGYGWWLWTCVAGVLMGLAGEAICLIRRHRIRGAAPRTPDKHPRGSAREPR